MVKKRRRADGDGLAYLWREMIFGKEKKIDGRWQSWLVGIGNLTMKACSSDKSGRRMHGWWLWQHLRFRTKKREDGETVVGSKMGTMAGDDEDNRQHQ